MSETQASNKSGPYPYDNVTVDWDLNEGLNLG